MSIETEARPGSSGSTVPVPAALHLRRVAVARILNLKREIDRFLADEFAGLHGGNFGVDA